MNTPTQHKTLTTTLPELHSIYADNPGALENALRAYGDRVGIEYINEEALKLAESDYSLMSYAECSRRNVIYIKKDEQYVWVVADPSDNALITALSMRCVHATQYCFSTAAAISARLRRDEAKLRATDSVQANTNHGIGDHEANLTLASISSDQSPNVKFVNATLYDAWRSGASDIHYETTQSGLHVKQRLDGVLCSLQTLGGIEQAEQIVSRLKVMAELDIAERRIPQDGRFKLQLDGKMVDFRVSVMPSALGEDVVVRVLDKRSLAQDGAISLAGLGYSDADQTLIEQLALEPHGMLLVTGPTGSGKTTTLYAVVNKLNNGEEKIVTIEDPVEYQLPGVLQIPVNDKKGLTFARGLRSILRHDPDKILVGEIRDSETAQIAIQSALTGHLVLTTVHANNSLDVIGRFSHMGVDIYNFASAINGVVAQRLIRKLCPHCKVNDCDTAHYLQHMAERSLLKFPLYKSVGCSQCRGTGYLGRTVIVEVLMMTDELRERIVQRKPITELKRYAVEQGFETLRTRAIELVRKGETSLQELVRVVGLRGN